MPEFRRFYNDLGESASACFVEDSICSLVVHAYNHTTLLLTDKDAPFDETYPISKRLQVDSIPYTQSGRTITFTDIIYPDHFNAPVWHPLYGEDAFLLIQQFESRKPTYGWQSAGQCVYANEREGWRWYGTRVKGGWRFTERFSGRSQEVSTKHQYELDCVSPGSL